MSRERELLQRALDVLIEIRKVEPCSELIADIRAELDRPEPVECGVFEITKGSYGPLIAVRIDDE